MENLKVGSLVPVISEEVVIISFSLRRDCFFVLFKGSLKNCPFEILEKSVDGICPNVPSGFVEGLDKYDYAEYPFGIYVR